MQAVIKISGAKCLGLAGTFECRQISNSCIDKIQAPRKRVSAKPYKNLADKLQPFFFGKISAQSVGKLKVPPLFLPKDIFTYVIIRRNESLSPPLSFPWPGTIQFWKSA